MREILFNAKSLETGKWIEGYYVYYSKNILKDDLHMIVWGKNFQEWDEVDPETVCQYIGLTDKHGVEIFEGDSVRVCLDPGIEVGKVAYDSRIAAFIIAFKDAFSTFLDYEIARKKVGDKVWVEVINNTMEEDNYEI